MIRPRSSSGTVICTVVLQAVMNVIWAKPRAISTTTARPNRCTNESAMSRTDAVSAGATTAQSGGRPTEKVATASAPITAPTPSEAISRPKPCAPSWSTLRAISGTSTFMLTTKRLTESSRPKTSAMREVPSA